VIVLTATSIIPNNVRQAMTIAAALGRTSARSTAGTAAALIAHLTHSAPTTAALRQTLLHQTAGTSAELVGHTVHTIPNPSARFSRALVQHSAPASASLGVAGNVHTVAAVSATFHQSNLARQAPASARIWVINAIAPINQVENTTDATVFRWQMDGGDQTGVLHARLQVAIKPSVKGANSNYTSPVLNAYSKTDPGFEYDTSGAMDGSGPWAPYPSTGLTGTDQNRQVRYTYYFVGTGIFNWHVRAERLPS
jgi:hypothetical protein